MDLCVTSISQVMDHGLTCYVNQSGHGPWAYVLHSSVGSWTMDLSLCVTSISQVVDHGIRPCSHRYSGTVIRHKFVPVQLCRHIGGVHIEQSNVGSKSNIRA